METLRSRRTLWIAVAVVFILALILILLSRRSAMNPQTPVTVTQDSEYCTEGGTFVEAGRFVYPIAPQCRHLAFLGQLRTAAKSGEERMKVMAGVNGDNYASGLTVYLKKSPDGELVKAFQGAGMQCSSKAATTRCKEWYVDSSVKIS